MWSNNGWVEDIKHLMPAYRIHCKKCKKTVPCHGIWFKNSKVLCPECYSTMNEEQIRMFHASHPDSEAEIIKVGVPTFSSEPPKIPTCDIKPISTPIDQPESWKHFGTGLSYRTITQSSLKELRAAVKNGQMSKARFNIEVKRRKNKTYYNSLADVEEIHL